MYNYIFWVIYNRNINRDKGKWLSRHNASGILFFSVLIHFLFVVLLINKLFNRDLLIGIKTNTGVEVVLFLITIGFIYFYYNEKRIEKINNKFENFTLIDESYGGLVVTLLILIPLLTIMIARWKG